MIFGGGFIGLIDQFAMQSDKPQYVIQLVLRKTRIPRDFYGRLDPDFAFHLFAADMDMPPLIEVEAEKAHPIRAIRYRDSRHE
jgi:hypothetical protein